MLKTNLKKLVKEFLNSPNEEGLKKVYSVLDKAVKKYIFHKNKVARLKAKYSKLIQNKKEIKKTPVKKKVTKKTSKKAVK